MCAARVTVRLAAAAGLLAAAAVAAAEAPAALDISVPPAAVSVGDRVPITVTARGGEGWRWGDLAVADSSAWVVAAPPAAVAGSSPPVWELALVPLAVGEQALPALSVTARPPAGAPVTIEGGEAPSVTVASVLPPGEQVKPAPLRDPVGARGLPWEWALPWALAALPLLVAGMWWRERRRRRRGDAAAAPPLPPLEELEARLAELETALGGGEPTAAWCDGLAGAFRLYLERRSGAPAREMTSFELRTLARTEHWPEPVQRSLRQVMAVVDAVRFSRRSAGRAELGAAVVAARAGGRALHEFVAAGEVELEEAS